MRPPDIEIPLVGDCLVFTPYREGGNRWLMRQLIGAGSRLDFGPRQSTLGTRKVWIIKRRHAAAVITGLANEYGQIRVRWQAKSGGERCDVRCRKARGLDCHCSCQGVHHGSEVFGSPWRLVGATTLVTSGRNVWLERTVHRDIRFARVN